MGRNAAQEHADNEEGVVYWCFIWLEHLDEAREFVVSRQNIELTEKHTYNKMSH